MNQKHQRCWYCSSYEHIVPRDNRCKKFRNDLKEDRSELFDGILAKDLDELLEYNQFKEHIEQLTAPLREQNKRRRSVMIGGYRSAKSTEQKNERPGVQLDVSSIEQFAERLVGHCMDESMRQNVGQSIKLLMKLNLDKYTGLNAASTLESLAEEPAKQLVNQSVEQLTAPSIVDCAEKVASQYVEQSIEQLVNESVEYLGLPSVKGLAKLFFDRFSRALAGQFVEQLLDKYTNQLGMSSIEEFAKELIELYSERDTVQPVEQFTKHLVEPLVAEFAKELAGQSIKRITDNFGGQLVKKAAGKLGLLKRLLAQLIMLMTCSFCGKHDHKSIFGPRCVLHPITSMFSKEFEQKKIEASMPCHCLPRIRFKCNRFCRLRNIPRSEWACPLMCEMHCSFCGGKGHKMSRDRRCTKFRDHLKAKFPDKTINEKLVKKETCEYCGKSNHKDCRSKYCVFVELGYTLMYKEVGGEEFRKFWCKCPRKRSFPCHLLFAMYGVPKAFWSCPNYKKKEKEKKKKGRRRDGTTQTSPQASSQGDTESPVHGTSSHAPSDVAMQEPLGPSSHAGHGDASHAPPQEPSDGISQDTSHVPPLEFPDGISQRSLQTPPAGSTNPQRGEVKERRRCRDCGGTSHGTRYSQRCALYIRRAHSPEFRAFSEKFRCECPDFNQYRCIAIFAMDGKHFSKWKCPYVDIH